MYCYGCHQTRKQLYHPIIGYGEAKVVTRVDENIRLCEDCIEKDERKPQIGEIVGWEPISPLNS